MSSTHDQWGFEVEIRQPITGDGSISAFATLGDRRVLLEDVTFSDHWDLLRVFSDLRTRLPQAEITADACGMGEAYRRDLLQRFGIDAKPARKVAA